MLNSTKTPLVGIPQPAPKRIKVKVSPQSLPMLATICPAAIVGSEKSEPDGLVILVLEGNNLPDAEWGVLFIERESDAAMSMEIKALNA